MKRGKEKIFTTKQLTPIQKIKMNVTRTEQEKKRLLSEKFKEPSLIFACSSRSVGSINSQPSGIFTRFVFTFGIFPEARPVEQNRKLCLGIA